MKQLLRVSLCALAIVASAPHARAQAQTQTQAAAASPDPVKLELARRYYAAAHMDRMMSGMMRSMTPALQQSLAKANPSLTPDQRTAIAEASSEAAQDMMTKLIDRLLPTIADTFTEEELRGLIAFYEGPTGRAVIDKMPQLMAKVAPMAVELGPEMRDDLRRRLCEKTDCAKLATPPR